MFKIGEFSKLVRVSPRMLRYYEKCGLLYPAKIDPYTGYRQYSAEQIPVLSRIVTLRDLGFSVDEIGEIIPNLEDRLYMQKVLRAKAAKVKLTIKAEQRRFDMLMEMSDMVRKECNIMVYEVELKEIEAVKVLSLRGIIPEYNQEGLLWERLGRYMGEHKIAGHGDGYSTYYDEVHMEENPDVEIAIPVDELGENDGEFIFKEYEKIPLAATLRFSGPFDGGYEAASEKLAVWMEKNDYSFAGNLRGHVLVSPDDEQNPEKWMTELQVPVIKR